MTYNNIGAEIREKSKHYDNKKAIYSKDVGQAVWKGITWKELNKQMQNLSKALLKFGIKTHDNIGIFADNMPEWIIADVAIVSIRAVSTPIYATNSQKEATYIMMMQKYQYCLSLGKINMIWQLKLVRPVTSLN